MQSSGLPLVETPDVLIVGAGVIGTSIAMALSHLDVDVAVVERRHDVGEETSRANSGIANCGWSLAPGSLEAQLVCASSPRWEDIASRLGVTFRRVGLTLLAFSEEEASGISALCERATENGVTVREVRGDELAEVAPHASGRAVAGIYVPDEGVVDSVRLPVAFAEPRLR